jgi:hypothetical protein
MAKKSVWTINYAENKKINDRISADLPKLIRRTMDDRKPLEDEWLEGFRMWNVQKDENNYYKGNARLYIPEVRKNIEAQARQLTEAAFPNDDYLACIPGKGGTYEGADLQLQLRKFQIEQANLPWKMHIFNRQKAMFGTSVAFIPWKNEKRKIWMSAKEGRKIRPKFQEMEIFNGPDFEVKSLLNWYALNPLSWDFQSHGCFENSWIDRFELKKRDKAGEVFNRDELEQKYGAALGKDELSRFIETIEASNLVVTRDGSAGAVRLPTKDQLANKLLLHTQVHCFMELPEACLEDEDPKQPIPVVVDIYDTNHIGAIKRNKFFHQQTPYIHSWYIPPNADEFYGSGIPKATKYMQHEINSKAEQGMDSATLALNPIAIIDPAMAGNLDEFLVEPGAKWWASPNGVKLSSIPDVSPVAYQAIATLRSQIADFSDRSPALPAQLSGKSRTAYQAEIVASAAAIDVKSFQRLDELLVFKPLMEQWEALTDQNIEDKQILHLFGGQYNKAKRVLVLKNKTLGKYLYQWKASSITQNRQILSRQLIDFLKVVFSNPQMAQGMNLNLAEIGRMLYREGFALPNYEKVFGLPYSETTDPSVEFEMLQEGMEISVSPGDDDDFHMKQHDKDMAEIEDEADKEEMAQHQAAHLQQKQKKAEEAQQKAQMMQMMAAQQGQGQQRKSQGSGNRTQLSPNSSPGDMSSGGGA